MIGMDRDSTFNKPPPSKFWDLINSEEGQDAINETVKHHTISGDLWDSFYFFLERANEKKLLIPLTRYAIEEGIPFVTDVYRLITYLIKTNERQKNKK